jgi:hypothetical protein
MRAASVSAENNSLGDGKKAIFLHSADVRRKCTMSEGEHKNWRELCNAALGARDPDELLHIVQELNKVLKREEQVRRDFREAMRTIKPSGEIRG